LTVKRLGKVSGLSLLAKESKRNQLDANHEGKLASKPEGTNVKTEIG